MNDRWNEDNPHSYPATVHRLRDNPIAQAWLALMETFPVADLNPTAASMFSFAQGVNFALHALGSPDPSLIMWADLQHACDEFLKDCE